MTMLDWPHVPKSTCEWSMLMRWAGLAGWVWQRRELSKATEPWSCHLQDLPGHPLCLIVPLHDAAFCSPWWSQTLCHWHAGRPPSGTPTAFASQCSVYTLAWPPRELFILFYFFVVSLPFPTQATSLQNSLFVIKERICGGKPAGLRKACHLQ